MQKCPPHFSQDGHGLGVWPGLLDLLHETVNDEEPADADAQARHASERRRSRGDDDGCVRFSLGRECGQPSDHGDYGQCLELLELCIFHGFFLSLCRVIPRAVSQY